MTWHGFALNVTTDLTFFDLMVPCGIADVQMTSVQRELELGPHPTGVIGTVVRDHVAEAFAAVFQLDRARADADVFVRDLSSVSQVADCR